MISKQLVILTLAFVRTDMAEFQGAIYTLKQNTIKCAWILF
jgi:hypothetical protein